MSKPILGIITDTHIKIDNIELVKDIYCQFIETLKAFGLKRAVMMGDFFTSRANQSLLCLIAANEILDMFDENEITLYAIAGNHDKVSLIDEKSYLSVVCSRRKYVKLFEKETSLNLSKIGFTFHFLPYFKEGEEYLTRLSNLSIDNDTKNILFTHTSVNGVRNNDGTIVEGDIETDFFDFFDLIFSGHYHDFSELSETIIYPRSAYQANFGENENKGFTILNDDLSVEYVQSKFPLYKKIYVDIENKKEVNKILEENTGSIDNVRIILNGNQEQIQNLDRSRFSNAGLSIETNNIIERGISFEEIEDAEMISLDRKTVMKNFIEYSKSQEYTKQQMKQGFELIQSIQF